MAESPSGELKDAKFPLEGANYIPARVGRNKFFRSRARGHVPPPSLDTLLAFPLRHGVGAHGVGDVEYHSGTVHFNYGLFHFNTAPDTLTLEFSAPLWHRTHSLRRRTHSLWHRRD